MNRTCLALVAVSETGQRHCGKPATHAVVSSSLFYATPDRYPACQSHATAVADCDGVTIEPLETAMTTPPKAT